MTDTHPFSRVSQATLIISHQPPRHSGMNITPFGEEWAEQQAAERIRGGCCVCLGGGVWVVDPWLPNDTDRPAGPQSAAHSEQPTAPGPRRSRYGGSLCGVGANKDNEDLEMQQRPQQEARAAIARAAAARPTADPPMLQPPPPAATRVPSTSNASKRASSLQGGGPRPQPGPGRRMPAKTLPPHLARPDLVQPPRQSGSRTQSMGPRTARPSLL